MKYSKAEHIFPEELLAIIQEYVQGELVYIPKPKEKHKKWGDNTHSKALTSARNREIRAAFEGGSEVDELSRQYFLSIESIKKIVYRRS